ncbi:hypothetical protein L7F22_057060 [Adiantum nelumboides]|nr:hypothetical protein [Adiantum nelumboides]
MAAAAKRSVSDMVSSAEGDSAMVISNIWAAPTLVKTILSFGKAALDSMDAATVNHVLQDVAKVSGNVPLIGVGILSLTLIISAIATSQDNKEKRDKIREHAEFLKKNLLALGEEEMENFQKEILILLQQACILKKKAEDKWREQCIFRLWSCIGDVATAPCNARTLASIENQLKVIHTKLDTLTIARQIHLSPKYARPVQGTGDFVGLESRSKLMMDFLEQPGIHVVGIYGTGGIGKTTLLRHVKREIERKKKHIVAYVEVGQNPASIPDLQQEILLQISEQSFKFHDEEHGRDSLLTCAKQIKDRNHKGICLILDNVWKDEHLRKLLPENLIDSLPPSSILIMSSRPKEQAETFCRLVGAEANNCMLYEPPPLDRFDAEHLFRRKAGAHNKDFTEAEYELVRQIVPLYGGLPLALAIIGSYFNNRNNRTRDKWENVKRRIRTAEDSPSTGEEKIFTRLELSLDLQTQDVQQRFVDVALFWKGKPWADAEAALTKENMTHLEDQSLVVEDELHKTVRVHDLMVSLAIKRAKLEKPSMYVVNDNVLPPIEEGLSSTNMNVDITDLAKQKNINQLRGLSCTDKKVDANDLAKMSNLRFLILDNCRIQMSFMHQAFDLHKLFLHSPRKGFQLLLLLLMIASTIIMTLAQFSYALIFIPLGFTFLFLYLFPSRDSPPTYLSKDLTFVTLKNCVNTISLAKSIGTLSKLRSLNLSQNEGFSHFPSSTFSKLTSLCLLNLSNCEEVTKLPDVSNMRCLEVLNVSSCKQLQELPKTLGKLERLKELDISSCNKLVRLPETIGDPQGKKL